MNKIAVIINDKINLFNFKTQEEFEDCVLNNHKNVYQLNNRANGKLIQWKANGALSYAKIIELQSEKEKPYLIYFRPFFDEETMYEPFYGDEYFAGKIILDKSELNKMKENYNQCIDNLKGYDYIDFYGMNLSREEFEQGFNIIQLY